MTTLPTPSGAYQGAPATDVARLFELLKAQAYRVRPVTLASGQKSDVYIDCKQTVLTGEGHALCGSLMLHGLRAALDTAAPDVARAVGGVALGGVPLAAAVSLTASLAGEELPAVLIRKAPKGHGTASQIEAPASAGPGAHVVMVEDVVTTAGSVLRAIAAARAAGYTVDHVLALIDRGGGGREALADAGVTLSALFTLPDFGDAR